jgi:3-oxosteroid 1-dehydrogenase
VLGTGGYLSNVALVAQLESLPGYGSIFPAGADGSGFKCAASSGASIGMRRNNLATILGYHDPTAPDAPLTLASVQELPRAHVNLPCWMIFDGTYIEKWGFSGTSPGTAPSWVSGAPTLAELAQLVGIDEKELNSTVRRFNGFAQSGVDVDFGRTPAWDMAPGSGDGRNASWGAIAKPPFYAVKLSPSLEVAGSGIKTDEKARVLDWNGAPIHGLYAAGDVAVHDDFGTGYQAGLTLTSAMTFACIAIENVKTDN